MTRHHDRVEVAIDRGIAEVQLSRPDRHNGMDFEMLAGVNAACRSLRRQRDLRAVLIHGQGPSFCAGLDVKSVLARPARAAAGYAKLFKPTRNDFQAWSMAWRELSVPVVAAIHGNCFGAGLQLALGADLRIAAPDARLSIMESRWGLVPDMGGAALLRELLALDVAKELVFTGRILDGAEARELGLVTRVAADPLAAARELAAQIATRSPDAVGAAKRLLQDAWHVSEGEALAFERQWQRRLIGRANQRIATHNNLGREPVKPYRPRSV